MSILLNVNILGQQRGETVGGSKGILNASANAKKVIIRMPFGPHGVIGYHSTTRTVKVFQNQHQIIEGAYPAVTANGKT